jgi:probable phosphoglycerate mutase
VEVLRQRLARYTDLVAAPIYCSVLPRATETAALLAQMSGVEPQHHCGLCTYHFDDSVDGMSWDDYRGEHTVHGGGVFRPYERHTEPWGQLMTRTGAALYEIAIGNAGRTAIIVAHSETVDASLVALGNLPILGRFETRVPPTSITEWQTDDDPAGTGHPTFTFPRWTLVRLTDAAHLESAGLT